MEISAQVHAFLSLIAFSEGTASNPLTKNKGYDVIVSGLEKAGEVGLEVFTSYADHPFAAGRPAKIISLGPPVLKSTASGRYQLLVKWWRSYKEILNLTDFSPTSQDAVAVRQLQERHAIDLIEAGKIAEAITAASTIWASFPGTYSQGNGPHSMETLVEKYAEIAKE